MDLEEYIAKTIVSICSGVGRAKSEIRNGVIAPKSVTDSTGKTECVHEMRTLDFEIIVSVNSKKKLEVSGEIGVGWIKAFGKKANRSEDRSVNKICFSIPFLCEAILPPEDTQCTIKNIG